MFPTLKVGASIAFANRLHPLSENVDCCIEISVRRQATFRAAMDSFREIFFDRHAAPGTHLRKVLGINQEKLRAGVFCFARDGFCQVLILEPVRNIKIFKDYYAETVYQLAKSLIG
jgi:hypothetical protein